MQITIRRAGRDDVPAVLSLLDGATEWLVARGRTGQWGTTPHSTSPRRVAQLTGFADEGELWVAEADGRVVGADGRVVDADGPVVGADGPAVGADGPAVGADGADGRVVGALAVGAALDYVPPAAEPELYVRLLVTERASAGQNLGAALLDHARELARADGVRLLRVDCFAGDDQALVRYYERQGFTRYAEFAVPRVNGPDWPGQVLAQRL
ncbi:GNAT superfamily N-acetyltransferase [Kribbella aluminosa]|uniref:GNAT superfamily N-acetyltransferase n=1 Tax=Kribbella aluminosa TaxID=416017 RepID=A0ABS4UW15_9ACTN|nr:GNAT family N-acetyltransferase [Kribbella aluminosa]MBP2355719.1 GNAT superfamily N-acetyltransferase [Kribbella aluminosa]